jgi:predicted DNA-binding transcriptional regulator AlpA
MKFLRFKDLKQRNIVRNWTTLTRLMREQDFPAGARVGAQARAWDEAEVEAWLESRRIASPVEPPRSRSPAMPNALADRPRR